MFIIKAINIVLMLRIKLLLLSIVSFLTLNAQQVTNIQVIQENDKVVITYDISSNNAGQTFDIKVECSTDGGKTFSIIPKSLTGDLKGIKAEVGKRIVWDVLSERETLSGDHFVFQLVATDPFSGNSGTFTDARDGEVYKWVKIGNQIWMAEDLRTTKYNDGTSIPNVTDDKAWGKLKTPSYDLYNKIVANKNTYAALYNWYAANTLKLAPTGWHVPTDAEWTTLIDFIGGKDIAGGKLKETGTSHWKSPNAEATNETGFTALPGVFRTKEGSFYDVGIGRWWSSTDFDTDNAWGWCIFYNDDYVDRDYDCKSCGFSVRCVKN